MLLELEDKQVRAKILLRGEKRRLVIDYPATDTYRDLVWTAFAELLRRYPIQSLPPSQSETEAA